MVANRFQLILVIALQAALVPLVWAADEAADAIATITAMGGKVTLDETQAGKPATSIRLYGDETQSDPFTLIARITTLTDLNIAGDLVTDDRLKQLHTLTNLKSLRISSRTLTDAGLSHLAKLPALRELNLRCSIKITDQGLASLGEMKHIETLALYMHATAAGIAHLKGMTALRQLNLANMQLTDDCITPLRELPNLRELALTSTPITEACLGDLMAMKQLEKLDIRRTKISTKWIEKLQAALPKCEILR